MPELPEVQTTVNQLKNKVVGLKIKDVWTDFKGIVKKTTFSDFKRKIKNKEIKKVKRRAKNIIFDLSENFSLLIHLKLTGHLLYGEWERKNEEWQPQNKGPLEDKDNTYIHLIFFLNNKKMLALSNKRKFAKAEIWETEELKKELKNLGPEPLDKDFTFEKFKKVLENRRAKIKSALMNQKIIAGIGNIYSDEALWRSKIHPLKRATDLTEEELLSLYKATKEVLKKGIELGGESISDYRNLKGEKGEFDRERKAYRRKGEKCFRCREKIKRVRVGGRSAHFCPKCQKLK